MGSSSSFQSDRWSPWVRWSDLAGPHSIERIKTEILEAATRATGPVLKFEERPPDQVRVKLLVSTWPSLPTYQPDFTKKERSK